MLVLHDVIDCLDRSCGAVPYFLVVPRLAFLRFTSKLGELVPFRRWLRVEPPFALLTPGERAEFRVSVFIDRLTARVRQVNHYNT